MPARCLKVDLHMLLDCIFELIHQGLCKGSLWKPRWLRLRRPAPILKPNPMSSHSACSSREFCMTCAAPRDKGRMECPDGGEAGEAGRRLQEGGRERVEIQGLAVKGNGRRRGHTAVPVCMWGGFSSSTTSPTLGHWPLCRIHIKNSGPVKMTLETNPVTSSALEWPLVDVAGTVCHFQKLPVERRRCVRESIFEWVQVAIVGEAAQLVCTEE